MGELVLFENEMNKLQLGGLSKTSMNIFMTLCQKMKNKGTERVSITFSEIKEKSGYAGLKYDNKSFIKDLNGMVDQLLAVNSTIIQEKPDGGKRTYRFDLFPTFIIDEGQETLEVAINSDFLWLLNEFQHYTSLDLEELVGFKSKYSKNLFRLIRQWKGTGRMVVGEGGQETSLDDFRKKIGVRDSYSNKEMMRSCIATAVREINERGGTIKNLKYNTKYASKRGRPLSHIVFTWDPVKNERQDVRHITEDSLYFTVKSTLSGHNEFKEDDISAIVTEARRNSIRDIDVKKRISYALKQEGIQNMTGYMVALMRKFNSSVEIERALERAGESGYAGYGWKELEDMLVNMGMNTTSEGRGKTESRRGIKKFTDYIEADVGENREGKENGIKDPESKEALKETLEILKK